MFDGYISEQNSLLIPFTSVFQKLMTDFDLVVLWNTKSSVAVYVPHTYWNSTCGLCGTLDGDKTNDFQTPEGTMVSLRDNDLEYFRFTKANLLTSGGLSTY